MYATHRAVDTYAQVGIETSVVDANLHHLIAMLFEGAHAAISLTSVTMQRGEVLVKIRTFDKTISITDQGLQASLDHQHGGEIAVQPNNLHDYMLHHLLLANVNSDLTIFAEVDILLIPLQDA